MPAVLRSDGAIDGAYPVLGRNGLPERFGMGEPVPREMLGSSMLIVRWSMWGGSEGGTFRTDDAGMDIGRKFGLPVMDWGPAIEGGPMGGMAMPPPGIIIGGIGMLCIIG